MRRFVLVACVSSLALGCDDGGGSGADPDTVLDGSGADIVCEGSGEPTTPRDEGVALRPRSEPSEYVGISFTRPTSFDDAVALLDGTYGEAAAAGELNTDLELHPGVTMSVTRDPRTPEQVIVEIAMEVTTEASPARRVVFRGPATFATGRLVIETVRAAADRVARLADDPGEDDAPEFRVEHRIRSANGGELKLGVQHGPRGPELVVDLRGPRTSLSPGTVNSPMYTGRPYETVYGLVFFSLGRDDFDFFVNRAYGLSAGAMQNFRDFRLLPHDWLRLTVTPELDDAMVDVGFELVAVDGSRVPVARAPASVRAGEQFMQNVFLMVDTMANQEALEPGSSIDWEVPFYYDDPEGGGVVEVLARGVGGRFRIAYAVESPIRLLEDVDFVDYQGDVEIPDSWDQVDPTCAELGSEPAPSGVFHVTFDASSTVRNSRNLERLYGPVWGSVFHASDVTLAGPNPGAEAVASFHFDNVDVSDPEALETFVIDTQLLAGEYQILGFMDTDDNADPDNPDPDKGDPVFIPIGSYRLQCAVQPTAVEFALLRP